MVHLSNLPRIRNRREVKGQTGTERVSAVLPLGLKRSKPVQPEVIKFVFSLAVLIGGIGAGQVLRRKYAIRTEVPRALMRWLTKTCLPVISALSLWELRLTGPHLLWIPVVGAVISTLAFVPAFLFGRRLQLTRHQMGSYLGAAMFSNVGYSLGGFVCLVLFGEQGLALAVLYMLYLFFYMYGIGFPIARSLGSGKERSLWRNFVENMGDPVAFLPLVGAALGILLNISGIHRSHIFSGINQVIAPAATFVTMLAIGLQMKLEAPGEHKGAVVRMLGIKFVYSPLIGVTMALILGFSDLEMKVILVEAFMPSAITVLVMAMLFDLDQRLANFCWIYTTLGFFVFAPFLFVAVRLF
jgi:predicted permease